MGVFIYVEESSTYSESVLEVLEELRTQAVDELKHYELPKDTVEELPVGFPPVSGRAIRMQDKVYELYGYDSPRLVWKLEVRSQEVWVVAYVGLHIWGHLLASELFPPRILALLPEPLVPFLPEMACERVNSASYSRPWSKIGFESEVANWRRELVKAL